MQNSEQGFLVVLKQRSGGLLRRLVFGVKTRTPSTVPPPAQPAIIRPGRDFNHLTPHRASLIKPPATRVDVSPLSDLAKRFRQSWYSRIKYALDLFLALIIFIVTGPVVLLAMLLVKLTSRGPALYTQTRVGLDGKPFTIYKIRSMTYQCEGLTGARWSLPGDSRVTSIGRLLRKTHIDELPQLWNVLRGDMSLIGPRPERPEFVPQLDKALPAYRARLLVRPGVTGLAQVQLPPDTNLESVRIKLAYDIWYVRHVSFLLDLRILLGTAGKVVGLPFGFLRALLGFARRERVETSYEEVTTLMYNSSNTCVRSA